MTRSKLEFATILASLRADGSDPQKLAAEMSLRKLCYEIEKIEEAIASAPPAPAPPAPKKRVQKIRPFWAFLTLESSDEE